MNQIEIFIPISYPNKTLKYKTKWKTPLKIQPYLFLSVKIMRLLRSYCIFDEKSIKLYITVLINNKVKQ